MVCKGICTQYKTTARYEENHKRCRMCDIFIQWEGARCPCCSFALRTRARNAKKPLPKETGARFVARYT